MMRYTIFLTICFCYTLIHAQYSNNIRIGEIDFFVSKGKINIEYTVYNMPKQQEYCVSLYFIDVDSNIIIPKYLTGDQTFHKNGHKTIVCELEKESASLKGDYYVQIIATLQQNKSYVKSIAYSGIMPGLGSYVTRKKGPTYIWGILGYGMLGSSLYYNKAAQKARHSYLYHSDTPIEADKNFKQSLKHRSISNLSAGISIIIWSVFLADAIIATKHNREIKLHPEKMDISIPYISCVSPIKSVNFEISNGNQSGTK